MKKITIIGVGLIGGSLGLALRKSSNKYFVTGIGRNPVRLKAARRLGAVDVFTTDYSAGVKAADIVVICLPVHLIAPALKKILLSLKPGAVVTDAGSVKGSVIKEVNKVLTLSQISNLTTAFSGVPPEAGNLKSISFVGAHPMAGSEKSGVAYADRDLYKGAVVAVTGSRNKKAENEVVKMWKDAGAKIVRMEASSHDRAVALVSHLPHVIAFNMCALAQKLERTSPGFSKLAAGSFRDITRVADSNPADWASICSANNKEVSKAIDSFIGELKAVKSLLSKPGALEKRFAKAKAARIKLLKNR